jgi:hypothetical protein
VTGVLIRARNAPDTPPANHSVVAFEGTVIVLNALQMVGDPDSVGVEVIGALPGQHSIVTAPADTEPLPVMLNVVNLGSKKNWVNPSPVVAAFWNA